MEGGGVKPFKPPASLGSWLAQGEFLLQQGVWSVAGQEAGWLVLALSIVFK